MKTTPLTVEAACKILEELGSNHDPIFYRGLETTAEQMSYSDLATAQAGRIRIMFYGLSSRGLRRMRGSLKAMIRERLR